MKCKVRLSLSVELIVKGKTEEESSGMVKYNQSSGNH